MTARAAAISEMTLMGSISVLAALAARLNHDQGRPAVPALYFFTDPERTSDPTQSAERLPHGAALVYRHFGAPERRFVARQLARIARRRGLILLIAADPSLARAVGAAGVHWPERLLSRASPRFGLTLAAVHGAAGITAAARAGADACVLAPIFPTRSSSGRPPLGVFHASQLARAAPFPVIALGGINVETAPYLRGRGFSGFACVEALA
jgi:thiamine-phosphate pyrophosphorylase